MTITNQAEYMAALTAADNAVVEARGASRDAMMAFRSAKENRDRIALLFESNGPRPSLVDCIKEVSETQRRVASGELPSKRENRHMPHACDFNPRGRGFLDRATGRVQHINKSAPRTVPVSAPSMAERAINVRRDDA